MARVSETFNSFISGKANPFRNIAAHSGPSTSTPPTDSPPTDSPPNSTPPTNSTPTSTPPNSNPPNSTPPTPHPLSSSLHGTINAAFESSKLRGHMDINEDSPPHHHNFNGEKAILNLLDDKLATISPMKKLSELLGIRAAFIFIAFCCISAIALQFGRGYYFIYDCVGFIFPTWLSFKSLETKDEIEVKFWLRYWCSFSLFSLSQYILEWMLCWIPFYFTIKLITLLWLYLPWFRGANIIYYKLVYPFMKQNSGDIERTLDYLKFSLNEMIGAAIKTTQDEIHKETPIRRSAYKTMQSLVMGSKIVDTYKEETTH